MTHTMHVTCSCCKAEHDERDVEFRDIEEDIQGRDVLTFICPACRKTAKGLRWSR